jgi:hypothetical protein
MGWRNCQIISQESSKSLRESIPQQSCSDDHGEQRPECYEHLEDTLRNPVMIKRSRQHDKV